MDLSVHCNEKKNGNPRREKRRIIMRYDTFVVPSALIVDDAKETSNTNKKPRDGTIGREGMMTKTTTTKKTETTNNNDDKSENPAKAGGSTVLPTPSQYPEDEVSPSSS